jgi:hypothetical protein
MRLLLLTIMVGFAAAAAGSPYFPLTPNAGWTLEDDDPAAGMELFMSNDTVWHGAVCHPRYETIDGTMVGITYWSTDDDGRTLLHGIKYLVGGLYEFYYDPPVPFLDPTMAPGELWEGTTNVFEVEDTGDHWWGEYDVSLTCVHRDPVETPLGTFSAVTMDPAWPGSPLEAAWRYGDDGIFTYAFGVGPARIQGHLAPEDLILVEVHNLVVLDVPELAAAPVLRAAPNPFNPATVLRFELPVASQARLEVYDVAGRRVATLCDQHLPAGPHAIDWRPAALGSGVYLACLTTGGGTSVARVTLVE